MNCAGAPTEDEAKTIKAGIALPMFQVPAIPYADTAGPVNARSSWYKNSLFVPISWAIATGKL